MQWQCDLLVSVFYATKVTRGYGYGCGHNISYSFFFISFEWYATHACKHMVPWSVKQSSNKKLSI